MKKPLLLAFLGGALLGILVLTLMASCQSLGVAGAFMDRPHLWHPDRNGDCICDREGEWSCDAEATEAFLARRLRDSVKMGVQPPL